MNIQKSNTSACLTPLELEQYVKDNLDSLKMHEIEIHLLSCSLCSDAVEGRATMIEPVKVDEIYQELNRKISERTGYTQNIKTVTIQPWLLSIAAAVLIGFMITFIIFRKSNSLSDYFLSAPIAMNKQDNVVLDTTVSKNEISNTDSNIALSQNSEIPIKTELIASADLQPEKKEKPENNSTASISIAGTAEKLEPIAMIPADEKDADENIQPSSEKNNEVENIVETIETKTNDNTFLDSKPVDNQNEYSDTKKQKMKKRFTAENNTMGQSAISASTNSRQTKDQKANFPGGEPALNKYIEDHLNYPQKAKDEKTEGYVTLEFTINKEGKIKDLIIKKSLSPELDTEALRLISSMPLWNPAISEGLTVDSKIELPVKFEIK